MNILFVLYHDFSTASAIHVHNFANLLVSKGHNCAVAVPNNKDSVFEYLPANVLYWPCTFTESIEGTGAFFEDNTLDIIHAWTPREIVRKQCFRLQEKYPTSKLVVHLEDNEEMIVESFSGIPYENLKFLSEKRLQYLLPDLLASPYHYPLFLEKADAVTVITRELLEFVPARKKSLRLWPVINLNIFSPIVDGREVRKQLEISDDQFVLCYVGSVHGVNAMEVRSLYIAVYLANRHGIPVRLIRAGRDVSDFLGDCENELKQYVHELGYVDITDVPSLMVAADLLIQPGWNDRFNRYRLPSKIPEFLAVGKPVAIPRVNIGLELKDGQEALIMEKGNVSSMIDAIRKIYNDRELGDQIGRNGRKFAEKNFSEDIVFNKLIEFYSDVSAI